MKDHISFHSRYHHQYHKVGSKESWLVGGRGKQTSVLKFHWGGGIMLLPVQFNSCIQYILCLIYHSN